ncbi:MAG: HTH domain-containing protein [Hydrotalea sp.]|jgi:predicted DNA-binding transcriptional regulator YafY|nr:HTH domain-containing protein [Hydrotalea sp.]
MPIKYIERLQKIDRLIKIKGTGTPKELAQKIGASRRTTIEIISVMKKMGAPIYYDKHRNSYCYMDQGHFNISFTRVQ